MRGALKSSPVGWGLVGVVVAIALLGPAFAPYGPAAIFGQPFAGPSGAHLLGLDYLGHDVLSRVLDGGRSVLLVGLAASLLAYAGGVAIGLFAGFERGRLDGAMMRSVDVLQAFPPIILVLLLLAGVGTSRALLIVAVALVFLPGVARLVRAATIEVTVRPYVEAAVARGEATASILWREVLPNIVDVILADVGIRFTGAILLAASINYLGLGPAPPAADWGLMAAENRVGIFQNALPVLVPVLLIALLAVGANLIADGIVKQRKLSLEVDAELEAERVLA